ncbi:sporulation protein YqfD [Halobacillus sp. A1]|uniref:sporulation protein YqfD n=1 Tax=Halobacillus sp. A1 TaxID=2880262 RepID=UPI0020A6A2CF|nr:sporulation protein YqfD [Halobacillus sp. A1]MCP3030354.1 sporulation protein YqfD [Halobacillus sp. A1]
MSKNLPVFQGRITIKVKGGSIESFMQACVSEGCVLSQIKHLDDSTVLMTIRVQDWPTFKKYRKRHRCRIQFVSTEGLPFFYNAQKKKKALWLAIVCSCLAVFLLANTLWSIKVEGLEPELEAAVKSQLDSYGIKPGSLSISMKQPREVQRLLLEDIPDLLWVGVKKQGTSYQLYGVKQTNYDEPEAPRPSNIVASKKGMITKMFISKGRPLVEVNDVVKKGKMLATGELKEDSGKYVEAVGEVLAETWYRVEIDQPEQIEQTLTDGNSSTVYSIAIGKVSIPVWGFWRKNDEEDREERYEQTFELFGWELPVRIGHNTTYENEFSAQQPSKEQSVKEALKNGRNSLLVNLNEDAEILDEKILHQGVDRGKVKLILLFKVEENIAETKYVSQGD